MGSDICVVIPVYDRPLLAEEAIASALAQRPVPSIVVVDDHCARPLTPGIESLVASGAIRVVGDINRGTAGARNFGARHTDAQYLLFLDDDDHLAPKALAGLHEALERDPSAVAAGGGVRYFRDGEYGSVRWPIDLSAGIAPAMLGSPFHTVGQVLIRRDAFEAIGGFSEQRPFIAEDWDLYVRLLTQGAISTLPIHAVDYRQHAGSQTATTRVAHLAINLCLHYRRSPPSPEVAAHLDAMLEDVMSSYLGKIIWAGRRELRAGNWRGAMKEFSLATRFGMMALATPRGRAALARVRRAFRE